jgi:HlyD family secretion protein
MSRKWIFGLSTLAIVIIAVSAIVYANREKSEVHNVKVEPVKMQDITSTINANGVIEEVNRKDVYPEQALKVNRIFVKKGDYVKVGDKIVEYDVDQIRSQYRELLDSKTTQKSAVAKIESHASDEYMAASGSVNQQSSNANVNDNEEISKLMSQYGITGAQQGVEVPSDAGGINEINLESQKQSLKSIENRIDDMKKLLDKISRSTTSPISGVVSEVNVTEGGYAGVQMPAFRIIDNKKLQVRANIKEFDMKKVKVGQGVLLTGDAIDENDNIKGKVVKISPIAKRNRTATGEETLLEVLVSLDDYYSKLIPGLSATCKIITGLKENVPVINFMALKEDKNGNRSIFVVDKDGKLLGRPVKLGISSEMKVEIVEGVSAGERVVLNWKPNFKTGDKVKIQEEA